MYVVNLSYSTTPKNKLEKAFSEYLKEINRRLIPTTEIEKFKVAILKSYDLLCEQNPRCVPVKKEFGKGHNYDGDFILYGSNTTCSFLKSKDDI